jgi:competence protein ComEC
MNDLWTIGLAVATTLGAWASRALPWSAGAAVAATGLVIRRPALLCVGAALLASGLGARAWDGTAPLHAAPFDGVVTLLDDPEAVNGAIRVTVRASGHRVEAWARGGAGRRLAVRQAGEHVGVVGELGPVRPVVRRLLAERHIAGQLQISRVFDHDHGDPLSRGANRVRRALVDGAATMSPAERALFTGFVLGDDRAEPRDLVDDFQASGLSHLTAVSGENLAFLMVLAGPALRRLTLVPRFCVTVGLIGWFALLTRFEPSVVRAAAMAAIAATATVLGRPASTIRLLSLAVAVMVLIDPLLVWSVGWWLSVGATAGIAGLATPLAARLPGPRPLAQALAVTVAAQVGVAPVAITAFGGLPVVSVPANLLAVPVAGPLMMWGLPAGVVAGLVPPTAAVLHTPTRLGVRWIALVARVGARAPLGEANAAVMIGVGVVVLAVVWVRIASPGARGSPNGRVGAWRRRAAGRRGRRGRDGGRGGAGGGEGSASDPSP